MLLSARRCRAVGVGVRAAQAPIASSRGRRISSTASRHARLRETAKKIAEKVDERKPKNWYFSPRWHLMQLTGACMPALAIAIIFSKVRYDNEKLLDEMKQDAADKEKLQQDRAEKLEELEQCQSSHEEKVLTIKEQLELIEARLQNVERSKEKQSHSQNPDDRQDNNNQPSKEQHDKHKQVAEDKAPNITVDQEQPVTTAAQLREVAEQAPYFAAGLAIGCAVVSAMFGVGGG